MLNKDQAQSVQAAYDAYQSLKTYCDQNNLDINTILTVDQKKEMQVGMQFLKIWMPKVQAMFISKKGFGALVESIINEYLTKIHVVASKAELAEVNISDKNIASLIGLFTAAAKHPVVKAVQTVFNTEITKAVKAELTFPKASLAIQTAFGTYTAKYIKSTYFKGSVYGGSVSELAIQGYFPSAVDIADAFENLADKNDSDHPDNVRAVEDQNNVEQAKHEKAIELFCTNFSAWLEKQKSDLNSKLDSADRAFQLRLVDENLLKKHLSKMATPKYAADYWYDIASDISVKVEKTQMPTLDIIKDFAEKVLNKVSTDTKINELAEKAIGTSESSQFPGGLVDWLESGIRDTSYQLVKDSLENWAKPKNKVVNAVDDFIRDECNNKPSQKMNKVKVLQNFKHILFRATPTGAQPGKAVFNEFEKNLPGTDVFSADQLKEAWKTTVMNSMSDDAAKAMFGQLLLDIPDWKQLEKTMGEITTTLPSNDEVVTACNQSKHRVIPPSVPKLDGDTLYAHFDIKSKFRPGMQHVKLSIGVPLRYVTHKTHGKEFYQAVPTQDLNIINQGGKGYEIPSKPKQVIVHPFAFEEFESYSTCTTSVTLVIPVQDTAQYTVVKEAKTGSMGFNLDASMLPGVADIIGEDNAKGLLGAGVNIVGNEYGNIEKLEGSITLLGFKLVFGVGKDGVYGFCESPLALKEAVIQFATGGQNFDLYLTFNVSSDLYYVNAITTSSGKIGGLNGEFAYDGVQCTFNSGKIVKSVIEAKK